MDREQSWQAGQRHNARCPGRVPCPQAWLRQLRSDAPPRLSAFGLAISFMLAGIQRFEQPVTGEGPAAACTQWDENSASTAPLT